MYEELVSALRELSDWGTMDYEEDTSYASRIAEQAADVIEELLKYKDIFEMMRSVGGIWGFGQDGRLYHLEVKPPEGSGSVRVFPAETGRPDTDGIHKFWEEG